MKDDKLKFGLEHAAMLAIFLIIIVSSVWLFMMANAMKSQKIDGIKVEYVIEDADNQDKWYRQARVVIAKSANEEARCLQAYKDAEDHLREQMNAWLTILGFFGVLFGLLVPLASYMLQKQSLAEERERVTTECDKKIESFENRIKEIFDKAGSNLNGNSRGGEGEKKGSSASATLETEGVIASEPKSEKVEGTAVEGKK